MDARELRIGNWIFDDLKRESEVSNLSALSVEAKTSDGWTTVFRPEGIPITEDLVIKCGFKFHSQTSEHGVTKDFFIIIGDRWGKIERWSCNGLVEWKISLGDYRYTTIYSIHQLQNILYAISGNELELKLN